jgi:SAM-dependent methyltransferase
MGINAVPLAEEGLVVDALDFSAEGLRLCDAYAAARGVTKRVTTIHADMTRYPYPRARYDLVIAIGSLQNAVDARGVRAMARVIERVKAATRPGGRVYLLLTTETRAVTLARGRADALTGTARRETWRRLAARAKPIGYLTREDGIRALCAAFADRRWDIDSFEVPTARRETIWAFGDRELRRSYWIELVARRI